MSLKVSVKIDWLTITGKATLADIVGGHLSAVTAEWFAKDKLSYLLQDFQALEAKTGNKLYPWVFEDQVTGVTISISDDLPLQGWKVEMTGGARIPDDKRQQMLQRAVDAKMRLTRIDVAFDLMNSGIEIEQVYNLYKLTPHRGRKLFTDFKDGITGETFYIGSRHSAYCVRLYNKGKEQRLADDWKRFEIELKEYAAQHWAEIIAYDPAQIEVECRRMLDLPGSAVDVLLASQADGVERERAKTPYTAPQTEIWWRDTVMPSFRKLVHSDRELAQRLLEGLQGYFFEGWSFDTINGLQVENE